MSLAQELGAAVGVKAACEALGVSRATLYRRRSRRPEKPRRRPARALGADERQAILDTLHSERFADASVPQVQATLLTEGTYLGSVSTMYRVLRDAGEVRERRRVRRHPAHTKPVLTATGPNQVWTWDITKLPGPPGSHFSLYVVLDLYSRLVVAWLLADRESATLAERLLETAIRRHTIAPGTLTIHSDRGAPMTSRTVRQLLDRLDVARSLSRPRVSNDNPFSESQFKTTKYNPWFPERFDSMAQAKAFCRPFVRWYNDEHCHSGIAMLTPRDLHEGRADAVLAKRQATLDRAYAQHPERFPNGPPTVPRPPRAVHINPAATTVDLPPGTPPQAEEVEPTENS